MNELERLAALVAAFLAAHDHGTRRETYAAIAALRDWLERHEKAAEPT